MEELREKYEGLELTDSQILEAYTLGLTPEQIEGVRKAYKQLAVAFEEMWENLMNAFKGICSSKEFRNFIDTINRLESEEEKPAKRSKKGKQLKPWQKNNFYN